MSSFVFLKRVAHHLAHLLDLRAADKHKILDERGAAAHPHTESHTLHLEEEEEPALLVLFELTYLPSTHRRLI